MNKAILPLLVSLILSLSLYAQHESKLEAVEARVVSISAVPNASFNN